MEWGWVQLIIAVITSGTCSSVVTYALTRGERRDKRVISRSDLADKLDTLIDQKTKAEATLQAREIENHKLTGRLEANEKLLVSVIESQGAAKEKERQCQEEVTNLRKEVALMQDRLSVFETANAVIANLKDAPA